MDRDNHAGKNITIGWIAGMFDGEGYIGLWRRTDHRENYRDPYRVQMTISNTDKPTIVYLSEQLKLLGIPHHIKSQRRGTVKWRENWCVTISGMRRLKKFVDFFEEHCVTKKEQIALVKEFIDRRMAVNKNVPYCNRDHEIYEQLKLLKRGVILRDYTLNASVAEVKI